MAIIAPFWATTDTYSAFRDGHSKVYYQVYKGDYNDRSALILGMASEHVQRYTGKFNNFEASWVLVVTWERLCPYVYYYYYDNNCRWVRPSISCVSEVKRKREKDMEHFYGENVSDMPVMAPCMLCTLIGDAH